MGLNTFPHFVILLKREERKASRYLDVTVIFEALKGRCRAWGGVREGCMTEVVTLQLSRGFSNVLW